ncbi:MAG: U32 family peptidase [Paludibacteraceae bacterium]|nr:U32 family peptidase [Paludibacteraceae bacterium]
MNDSKIELLSPAKNLECGFEAVNHGADAVYIGAEKFGARSMAGNSVTDIEKLVRYAHLFGVKIYVTINTILYDNELEAVRTLIYRLYEAGVDALIVQDLGLLQLDLPPIALHASTQTNNRTIEKVDFLRRCGFTRVVLARELSLNQIAEIHNRVEVELEAFVHGALCVSYSGQCYMSQYSCGRSANRGECAQYCRLPYSLQDAEGRVLLKNKHLLSLKDLNRSAFLQEMIQTGVRSFKIEGRLKDVGYVKNITAYYRQRLDDILEKDNTFERSSCGRSVFFFEPNPEKTFTRKYTDYFLNARSEYLACFETPKSMGEKLGVVKTVFRDGFEIQTDKKINNGDGLCFVDKQGELQGFRVNRAEANRLFVGKMPALQKGDFLYRNYDQCFEKLLSKKSAERKIAVDVLFEEIQDGFRLTLCDEEKCQVSLPFVYAKNAAQKKEQAQELLKQQMIKFGDTIFCVRSLRVCLTETYFFPSSVLAVWRKQAVEALLEKRIQMHSADKVNRVENRPQTSGATDYRDNVSNKKAAEFYTHCGGTDVAFAYELNQPQNAVLMHCKYCLKYELGWCKKQQGRQITPSFKEPLFLNYKNRLFKLVFDCKACEMKIENV